MVIGFASGRIPQVAGQPAAGEEHLGARLQLRHLCRLVARRRARAARARRARSLRQDLRLVRRRPACAGACRILPAGALCRGAGCGDVAPGAGQGRAETALKRHQCKFPAASSCKRLPGPGYLMDRILVTDLIDPAGVALLAASAEVVSPPDTDPGHPAHARPRRRRRDHSQPPAGRPFRRRAAHPRGDDPRHRNRPREPRRRQANVA